MSLYGAIEAGGTKFLCAIGDDPADPREIRRFSTSNSNPLETMAEVIRYFETHGPVDAIGVASFGPLDLARGTITNTPKLAWRDFPLRQDLERAFSIPVAVDTDVNIAALGEMHCGAGRGVRDFVYLTIGTGIGGGAVVNGRLVHGSMHPEMGHIPLRPAPGETFTGVCPFHENCLEGLASGPAIRERWGVAAEELPPDHAAWELEAEYLGQASATLACLLSPQRILLGGGVMTQPHMMAKVEAAAARILRGYLKVPEIQAPALPYPALSGALVLAKEIEA